MGTWADRFRVAVTLLAVAVGGTACSAPPPRSVPVAGPVPATAASPLAGSAPLAGPARVPCFRALPATWRAGPGVRVVGTAAGWAFTVWAVAGGTAYGQYRSAAGTGVGALDLASGRIDGYTRFGPDAGGVGALVVDGPWLVWEQLDARAELRAWSVHAWRLPDRRHRVLADSRLPGGGLVTGPQPQPVLRAGHAVWAQPVPGTRPGVVTAELRVAELDGTGTTVLARGRLSDPVFAGGYLVWGTVDAAGRFAFGFADADRFQPVPPPAGLPAPGSIGQLVGAPDRLGWSSADSTSLTLWPIGAASTTRYLVRDGRHFFQFMRLVGGYLVWFAGGASSVLELAGGVAVDVPGSVAGSAGVIALTEPGQPGQAKGAVVATRIRVVSVDRVPGLGTCG